MDSMEVNKGVAAVLTAGIAFFVSGLIASALVSPKRLPKTVIAIEIPQPTGGGAPVAEEPLPVLLAKADPAAGESFTKKQCVACHTFNEDGKAGVGPNLYGVVGGPHAHMQGFAYSDALKAKQGPWTFDELNTWLTKPSGYAPGTKMTYAGIPNAQDRANVIDYLHTLSPNPEPLPAAPAQTASATPTAPAPGAAPAGGPAEPFEKLLASADPQKGQADTMKLGCVACHTFNEGGHAIIGPNLYGVVGAPHGHMPGFAYSAALKSKEGPWTFDELNTWLTKPSAYAPGTKMTFLGVADPKERADIIAYLRSLSPNPVPLPQAGG